MSFPQMGSALFFPLQLHFFTIIITIFVILPSFRTSNGIEDDYKECSSLVPCGDISNIEYPFWVDQFRPKYCGHSAFELVCPPLSGTHRPVLQIHGEHNDSAHFQVLGINNSAMTIVLLDFDPQGFDHCIFPFSNLTEAVAEDLIEYSTSVENITLSYDCKPNMAEALVGVKNYSCLHTRDDYAETIYYWRNDKTKDEVHKFCQSIQVPVLGNDNLKRRNVTLESVLEKGFEVNYTKTYLKNCSPCEKSGGKCGSSMDSGFRCFCKGWDSSSNCLESGDLQPYPPPNTENKISEFADT
uniref:non-specific serine/threonine protein kinase n=1 Tax=Opuntia streptacantha TaxID=393608 RepID=A0A7C9EJ20_OPUST